MLSQKKHDEINRLALLLNQCFYEKSKDRCCIIESLNIYDTGIMLNILYNGFRHRVISIEDFECHFNDYVFYIRTDSLAKPENYVRRLKTYFGDRLPFDENAVVYTDCAEWRNMNVERYANGRCNKI